MRAENRRWAAATLASRSAQKALLVSAFCGCVFPIMFVEPRIDESADDDVCRLVDVFLFEDAVSEFRAEEVDPACDVCRFDVSTPRAASVWSSSLRDVVIPSDFWNLVSAAFMRILASRACCRILRVGSVRPHRHTR
jgi:hypothetical protein